MQKPAVISDWHALVARRSTDALDDLLAEDVIFLSPVVYKPQIGKTITRKYLAAALQVLNNDTFRYRNEWFAETSAVLEFETTVGNISINGVDIITWNEAGKIIEFKVLVRPLKAINLLHQAMASMLERMG
ncbi:MAG: nuclear transport factor 2 family protein [Beijerinckiaceae bacterium]